MYNLAYVERLSPYIKQYLMLLLNGFLCGVLLLMGFGSELNGGMIDFWLKGTVLAAVTFGLGDWEVDSVEDLKEISRKRLLTNTVGMSAALTPYALSLVF